MIVVVGGQTRNIGKTTLMCALIAATRDLGWTAIKITQFGHGRCSADGEECRCSAGMSVHPFTIDEESAPGPADSQRYLGAGALRSFWLRTRQGELAEAMPALRALLAAAGPVIIESNAVLGYLQPDLYFPVLHPDRDDFKRTARIHLRRATRVIQAAPGALPPSARGLPTVSSDQLDVLAGLIREAAAHP